MDPQEQMRDALKELCDELVRVVDHAGKIIRQVALEVTPRPATSPASVSDHDHAAAFSAIRELGRLRDEGLITEDEFRAKKVQLLENM